MSRSYVTSHCLSCGICHASWVMCRVLLIVCWHASRSLVLSHPIPSTVSQHMKSIQHIHVTRLQPHPQRTRAHATHSRQVAQERGTHCCVERDTTQTHASSPTCICLMGLCHGIYFSHPRQHTGIIMYIHHAVSYHILSRDNHARPYHPETTSTVVGFVWLSCPLLSQPIVLGGVYLSHEATEVDVIELKRLTMHYNNNNNMPVFLVGD